MHLFKQVVHLKPPDKNARKQILTQIVQRRFESSRDLELDAERPLNFVALATETEGYSATDLQDLVARAVHQAAVRSSGDSAKARLPERARCVHCAKKKCLGDPDCRGLQSGSSGLCAALAKGRPATKVDSRMG